MTTYVFDSSPFIILFRHYYPGRFPTLWKQFNQMVANSLITSTREVMNELDGKGDELENWCKSNREVFATPNQQELDMVRDIFNVAHFQAMIRKKQRLDGKPVADPFVVARARYLKDSYVVTGESHSPNAAKIPNVCEHFDIKYTNLQGFMEMENWQF